MYYQNPGAFFVNNLYETIKWFCTLEGKTIYNMCTDLGISNGIMSNLKNDPSKTLSMKTLQKIADYLELSVDDLLGTSPEREKKNMTDGLKSALFGTDDIPDEMLEEVKRYAEYLLGKSRGYF